MTTRSFRGDFPAVAKVTKITPANVEIGDVFTATINVKDVSYTALASTVADVVGGFVSAWNASDVAEFKEVTASVGTDADGVTTHVTLTADTPGKSFTVTSAATDGAGFEVVVVTSTAGSAGQNEKQVLTLAGTATGGTFTVTFSGQETGTIAFDATAATLETALEALSNIGVGDATVSGDAGGPWTVEFTALLAAQDVPLMTTDGTNLTGAADVSVNTTTGGAGGTNEVQEVEIVLIAPSNPTWGVQWQDPSTVVLQTNPMSVEASTAQVQAEFDSTFGPGNMLITLIDDTLGEGRTYGVEFIGPYAATDVNSMQARSAATLGISTTIEGSGTAIDEVQVVTLNHGPIAGTFALTFQGQTTGTIAVDATAGTVQTALEALSNIAAGEAVVTGDAGGPYTVTFSVGLGGTDVAEMTGDGTLLTGSSVYVATTQTFISVTNEVQVASITGGPTGGTFTLTFDGQTTAGIAFDATATAVTSALEVLSNIDAGEVAVAGADGGAWTVTFQNGLGGADVAEMTGNGAGLTGAGSQTFVTAALTANTGPNNWDEANNWDPAAIPVNGDDVFIQNSDVDITEGLDQSLVTLASLTIDQSYTGKIGLPVKNDDYYEYRETYLEISATTLTVGDGEGSGSQRIKIDTGANQTTLITNDTGSGEDAALAAFLWKGTHASNTVSVFKGTFGAASFAGETAVIATLKIGFQTDQFGDSVVECESGCTLTTIDMSGGTLTIESAATTITQTEGELTIDGAGVITTLNVKGGVCFYNSTGALTTATVTDTGVLDFEQNMAAKTVTNPIEVYGDAEIKDSFKVVASLIIDANETGADLSKFKIGDNIRITRGTPA